MKKWLSSLLVLSSIGISIVPSYAQEKSGCFMQDGQGKAFDLGTLCGSNSPNPSSKVNSKGNFRVPIKRRVSGVPVIDVIFNGKKHYEMAFDTGASWIAITPEMAKELKIKPETKAVLSTANGQVVVDVGRVSSAEVSGVVHKNLAVVISPGLSIGLLGQNFFGEHDVTIRADEILITSRSK